MPSRTILLLKLLILTSILILADTASAQRNNQTSARTFNIGDEVEYLWGGKWYPGTVLEVQANAIGIEYQWGGQPHRESVPALQLRFRWEAKAFTPMRFWSDASGKFRIRAAAVGLSETEVTLHKEDGTEATIAIDKLSDADQRVLRKSQQSIGPPIAELPPLSSFATNGAGWAAAWNEASDLTAVTPDPPPAFASMPVKGTGFPKADFHEDLIRVIPIGGKDGWMLAGTVIPIGDKPSRLIWAALNAGKVTQMQLLPPGERLAACDPANRQVLTVNPDIDRTPALTVFKVDPNSKQAEPVKRWSSLSEQQWGSWDNWAEFVGANRVIHEWGSKQYVVWDFESEREVYRIDQESFFGARPTISPGRKYLAVPEDKRVRVLESATGATLASLPINSDRSVGVGFNARGDQLAVLTPSELAIWTLGSESEPKRLQADMIGSVFRSTVEWVDDELLLIDRKILYDTQLQLPVWNYTTATMEVKQDGYGERTQTVLGSKLCYAVEVGGGTPSFIVGAVDLPGPGVREAVQGLDKESMYAIRPGIPVKLEVDCGTYNSEVQAALSKKIAENGWVLGASAPTVIRATMGRSKPQTVEYRNMMGGGGNVSVSVTPYFSNLEVRHGELVAWSSGSSTGLSPVMWLKQGESPQQQANQSQQPNAGFFSQVVIPAKILDPAKKQGLGTSLISSRGLTPQK